MEINFNGNFNRIEANLSEEDFKREWSHIETAGVKAILTDVLRDCELIDFIGKDETANDFFQFAWTSSGRFGTLNVLSPDNQIDSCELQGFLIRNNNQLIAHCFDDQENDVFFEVS